MNKLLTCLACGHEGYDVAMALVEFTDPVTVEVLIPVSYDGHGRLIGNEARLVPGRYGAEWRCHDKAACADRVLALSQADDVAAFFAGAER